MSVDVQTVCVFCGSASGRREDFSRAAQQLGELLVQRRMRLVYGGGNVGLMGVLADEVIRGGGQIIGVIPRHLLERELAHQNLTELRVVASMHERKALMAELSDAFVALPGGLGTLEELLEIMTWAQLGLHAKPIGILDVCHYFGPLLAMLNTAVAEGFLLPENADRLVVADQPVELLDRLAAGISDFRFQISDLREKI